MRWKKVTIVVAAIASCPVALILGGFLADWFYMRFIFHYPARDFAPGDAFGELILAMLFSTSIIAVALLVWRSLYKKIANSPAV